jgi:hypothetical protein|tara:strand:+ start:516 stop:1007 length:492 start_codon:yes stop_codon:yes gene_type:complete
MIYPIATQVSSTNINSSIPEARVVSIITPSKLRFEANVLKHNGKNEEANKKLILAEQLEKQAHHTPSQPSPYKRPVPSAPPMSPLPPHHQRPVPSAPPMPTPPPLPPRPNTTTKTKRKPRMNDENEEKEILVLTEFGVGNTGVHDSNFALGDVFTTQGRSNNV